MTGCPPCKVLLNEETNDAAAEACRLREFIIEYVDDGEQLDELLYTLAAHERQFIKGVREVKARFSTAIGAPARWQVIFYDLAGLPFRAVPGGPSPADTPLQRERRPGDKEEA